MQFIPLESEEQLSEIVAVPDCVAILKHNTTCSISNGVLDRLQADSHKLNGFDTIYVLDLLAHRELSNAIAGRFGVPHQSPQLLVIKDGRCTYHEWGFDISVDETSKAAQAC